MQGGSTPACKSCGGSSIARGSFTRRLRVARRWCSCLGALPETPRRDQSGGKYDKHNGREGVRKRSNGFPFSGNKSFLKAAAVIFLLCPLSPCPAASLRAVPAGSAGSQVRKSSGSRAASPEMGEALGHIREYLRSRKDEMRHL